MQLILNCIYFGICSVKTSRSREMKRILAFGAVRRPLRRQEHPGRKHCRKRNNGRRHARAGNLPIYIKMPLGRPADISFPDLLAADDVVSSRITAKTDVARKAGLTGTSRGRLGYPLDHRLRLAQAAKVVACPSQSIFIRRPTVKTACKPAAAPRSIAAESTSEIARCPG
jgi:hypothetical protein